MDLNNPNTINTLIIYAINYFNTNTRGSTKLVNYNGEIEVIGKGSYGTVVKFKVGTIGPSDPNSSEYIGSYIWPTIKFMKKGEKGVSDQDLIDEGILAELMGRQKLGPQVYSYGPLKSNYYFILMETFEHDLSRGLLEILNNRNTDPKKKMNSVTNILRGTLGIIQDQINLGYCCSDMKLGNFVINLNDQKDKGVSLKAIDFGNFCSSCDFNFLYLNTSLSIDKEKQLFKEFMFIRMIKFFIYILAVSHRSNNDKSFITLINSLMVELDNQIKDSLFNKLSEKGVITPQNPDKKAVKNLLATINQYNTFLDEQMKNQKKWIVDSPIQPPTGPESLSMAMMTPPGFYNLKSSGFGKLKISNKPIMSPIMSPKMSPKTSPKPTPKVTENFNLTLADVERTNFILNKMFLQEVYTLEPNIEQKKGIILFPKTTKFGKRKVKSRRSRKAKSRRSRKAKSLFSWL